MRSTQSRPTPSNHRSTARMVGASLAGATLLFAASASAHPFALYGLGSRTTAMGGAGTATATGASAVHYNPARLTTGPSSAFIGGYATFNDLQINLAPRPEGYDIPITSDQPAAWPVIPTEYRLNERKDPEQPGTGVNFALGAVSDLGFQGFRVGVIAALPVVSTVDAKTTFADEREQYFSNTLQWDLMGVRTEQATLELAAAYQVLPSLSVGVGASYMPATTLNNEGYLNAVDSPGELDLNVGMSIPSRIRPNFGLSWDDGTFSGGFAYRSEQYMELAGDTLVQARGTDPQSDGYPFVQRMNVVLNYQPSEVSMGFAGRFGATGLSLDATLEQWSGYRDNHNNEARVAKVENLKTVPTVDHGFADTLNVRLGLEHALGNERFVRLGAGFLPTPVPDQTGRSNFVDNDKVVLSAGVGGLLKYGNNDITINLHTQLLNLLPRETVKKQLDRFPACTSSLTDTICDELTEADIDPGTQQPWEGSEGLQTGNPGFPGWSSGGWALSAGLDATWNF